MSEPASPLDTPPSPVAAPTKPRLLRFLGPGLITGASDDDPSGIATYAQAGAQFGYALSWTLVLTWPLMVATQMVSARIGRTTGHGIAGVLRLHYPAWLLQTLVFLLLVANILNLGADLGAMADATGLLIDAPRPLLVILYGAICIYLQIFLQYTRYVSVLKWLSLTLLSYLACVAVVRVDWEALARSIVVPALSLDAAYLTTVVAVLGTTISPYLFFWQSAEEAEDIRADPRGINLFDAPEQGADELSRIEGDTMVGMGFSNLVALAILVTTAATLHASGIFDVQTSAQAALALRPIAGEFASLVFALGVVGTGLLAVPVLAGSAAYAIGEARDWPIGLSRRPQEAKAFYATITLATIIGVIISLTPVNPIKALYWSAVLNGVTAVPLMVAMMLMASRADIMGPFALRGTLRWVGWLATGVMLIAVAAMFAFML
ncbi:MAG: divalent metal cation transporter [Beijerinckiaceae bacterium]|nr:divalent metal cation transporter [Beijerinckiaceae bacterium]